MNNDLQTVTAVKSSEWWANSREQEVKVAQRTGQLLSCAKMLVMLFLKVERCLRQYLNCFNVVGIFDSFKKSLIATYISK